MISPQRIRIGTRKSPLALAQSEETAAHLRQAFKGIAIEIVPMSTAGDRVQDKTLNEIGGKGLFTKEIEDALLAGDVDIAVHSMKDMPTQLPGGLIIPCLLLREDPRDTLITRHGTLLADLPEGTVIGTASLRRASQILHLRPDFKIVPLRGNVQTRIAKLEAGHCDATLLAKAGLNRVGMMELNDEILTTGAMLPAVAQGAIGVECRANDEAMIHCLKALNHAATEMCVAAERAMLAVLDGSCRTPIAGLATIQGDNMTLDGLIAKPDGSVVHRLQQNAPATLADAVQLGMSAGKALLERAGKDFP